METCKIPVPRIVFSELYSCRIGDFWMLFNLENINCRSQESNLKNIIQGLLLLTSIPNQTTKKKLKKIQLLEMMAMDGLIQLFF
jgi:hypothetical protein